MAQFLHEGNAIDYVAGSDIAAGDVVVVGAMVGVASDAIPTGKTGALQIEGVFVMPNDGTARTLGDSVDWDGSTIITTAGAPIGIVVRASAASATETWVKLTPAA